MTLIYKDEVVKTQNVALPGPQILILIFLFSNPTYPTFHYLNFLFIYLLESVYFIEI